MSAHRPRKRFGQHFLRDRGVIQRIADTVAPQPGETIVEIGPGEGVLTYALLERVATLHAIELDRDLAAQLRNAFAPERLVVHQADALHFDFRQLVPHMDAPMSRATGSRERPPAGARLRLVGNLPYNISTPLLFHLLDQLDCIGDMVFMLQKEVVDRMAAAPDTADYGRLSVMIQLQVDVEPLFDVAPGAFHPPPKVDSTVVRLTPHAQAPVQLTHPEIFGALVKAAFASRRKTLRNNLRDMIAGDRLSELGIDPNRRAETLSLQEFARLANALPGSNQ